MSCEREKSVWSMEMSANRIGGSEPGGGGGGGGKLLPIHSLK